MTEDQAQSNNQKPAYPPVRQLYFYLTEGCNLACRHCWLAPKHDRDGTKYPSLPVDVFEKAIKEAKALGLQGVKLTGGEPLLHNCFSDLLEIVRREDLALTIETNGLLCTHSIAHEIARLPRRHVAVSIDGADAETHEWVRGVPGSFEKAKNAVRHLVANDTPPQIIMTLMRKNCDQATAVIRMAEELGASSVKFNVVQPTARGKTLYEDSLALSIKEIITIGKWIEKELSTTTRLRLIFDFPMAFRSLKRLFNGDGCSTCSIYTIMGVLADGRYALCGIGTHVPELVFGVVGRDSLETVWRENETLQSIREGLPGRLEGICSRCLMKGRCKGACLAQNYFRKKSLWAPYWFCEMAEEVGLFPESRCVGASVGGGQ